MKLNFFRTSKVKKIVQNFEEIDENGFTKSQLDQYDKNVKFYYTNIINSLILFSYNSEELEKMTPILIDPLTELYEEIEQAFTPVCFETVFRNELISSEFKNDLLKFKSQVDNISNEIWGWEFLDNNEKWKGLRQNAEKLLKNIGISHRIYNNEFEL